MQSSLIDSDSNDLLFTFIKIFTGKKHDENKIQENLNSKANIIIILRLLSFQNLLIIEKYFSLNIISNLIFDIYVNNNTDLLNQQELIKFLEETFTYISYSDDLKNIILKNCESEFERLKIIKHKIKDQQLINLLTKII